MMAVLTEADYQARKKERLNPVKEQIVGLKEMGLGIISTKNKGFEKIIESGKGLVKSDLLVYGTKRPGRPKSEIIQPNKPFDKYISAYTGIPIVAAAIDRTVDFVVSPGFYVVSESKEAKKEIEEFIEKMDFDIFLRNVVKNMLIYGDCFVEIVGKKEIKELKVLNPVTMRVKRTRTGDVTGYQQELVGNLVGGKWAESEIAHFIYNKIGDAAYGTSLIEPLLTILNIKVRMEEALKQIMLRKAGAPIHVKMGSDEFPATQDDIDSFATDLQQLTNKTEWVTGHTVEMDVVGFRSKIIDIEPFTQHIDNQMVYGLQVPYVLLGKGRIPEGLARVQLEGMDRRAKSIQLLVEQQLENKIFTKLTDEKIEFQWGSPSQEMFSTELGEYMELLKIPLSNKTKLEIENKIRKLLEIDGNIKESDLDMETEEGPFQKFKKQFGDKNERKKDNRRNSQD